MTRSYPRNDSITEHYGRCTLHGVPCCSICCKHEGECDFGDCNRPHVAMVPCHRENGSLIEVRPACERHAHYGPLGVGYGAAPKGLVA